MREALSDWLWSAEAKRPLVFDGAVAAMLAALCYALPGDGPLDPAPRAMLGAAVALVALPSFRAAQATVDAGFNVRLGLYVWIAHFAAFFVCLGLIAGNEPLSVPEFAIQGTTGAVSGCAIAYLAWRTSDRASPIPYSVVPMDPWTRRFILVWPVAWVGWGVANVHLGADLEDLVWELALFATVGRTAEPEDWRHRLSLLTGVALLLASIWLNP